MREIGDIAFGFSCECGEQLYLRPLRRKSSALAEVAELVDAHVSGACESNLVRVRVPPSAPRKAAPEAAFRIKGHTFALSIMASKRFRSRRQWYNVTLVLWTSPFALLIGVITFAALGNTTVLYAVVSFTILALSIALARDFGGRGTYTLDGERLILENRSKREEIMLSEILDVSLIDRAGAREYILSDLRGKGVTGFFKMRHRALYYVQFSSVDIGLRSYTLGIGRRMTDQMPDARLDLVLLRLRNGKVHFLTPVYNQEMVSAITRRTAED